MHQDASEALATGPPSGEPLPRGNHGLSRREVDASQRERLKRAVISALAQRGYPATTVKELVADAHVSKSTFYAHFDSKQACMLEFYDEIVEQGAARVSAAYRAQPDWHGRLAAAFAEFMEVIVSDPGAARLVLVDALALGGEMVPHRERAARAFELLLRQSFSRAPGAGHVSDTTVRAVVGGMRRLVYTRLHEQTVAGLPGLAGELTDWALSYVLAAGAAVPAPSDAPAPTDAPALSDPPPAPPPGADPPLAAPKLPAAATTDGIDLAATPPERIIAAVGSLVAEHGYQALTIPAISARARASNQTLYEHFHDKQSAFLAAFDAGAARALANTQAALAEARDWQHSVYVGTQALLRFLAQEHAFTRMAFVDLLMLGQPAYPRSELVLNSFGALLRPGLALAPNRSETVLKAITGGAWSVIHYEVVHGQVASLPRLTAPLSYVMLAPLVGAAPAAELIAAYEEGDLTARAGRVG